MAIACLACFPKRSLNLLLLRLLSRTYSEQKGLQPLPPGALHRDSPVQFTKSKASTIKIAEITGLTDEKKSKVSAHIVCASIAALLIYFCILREENDIDDILKGKSNEENDAVNLINLRLKLQYCESHNLPTDIIKIKIKELEDKAKDVK